MELIDPSSYYAQVAQLMFVLNELLEWIMIYRCPKGDIYPSNALRKCPAKRLFPMYYEMIPQPIDLTLIRQKLEAADYLSYQAFEEDLLLLFRNAIVSHRSSCFFSNEICVFVHC
jgi:hypothetical protein